MAVWEIFEYITEEGTNLIEEWYQDQEPEVRAQFDATFLILRATEDWEDQRVEEFKPLLEKHKGLGEVRFHILARAPGARRSHRRRFRPVGIWPPTVDRRFVLILGCEKRGMQYIPHDAFGLALQHAGRLGQGRGRIRERIW